MPKEEIYELRKALEPWGVAIKKMVPKIPQIIDGKTIDQGEARANIMLAYRHLEDCRMRLGKAIQAIDGGESVYPR